MTAPGAGTTRVLVADDEESIRVTMSRILVKEGIEGFVPVLSSMKQPVP